LAILDKQFGEIGVRRNIKSTHIKFSVAPSGQLRVSAPIYVSDFRIKRIIQTSRVEIAKLIKKNPLPAVKKTLKEVESLRLKAKLSLTPRVEALATEHGFKYSKLRFSTASTRWGSCSNKGTISLNIALVNLPDRLIDYVILHELSHTVHMNHSKKFWEHLEYVCPSSKNLKKQIAKYRPFL
jgi:predicted metal-dependent hydrolase